MSVSRFEDLVAWQKARILASSIYKLTAASGFSRDFGLKDQIQRAAVSVVSNIAEGFERGGTAEFHQFLVIAKASCAELRAQLYVALDVGYIDQAAFEETIKQAEEVARLVGGLRASLKR
ncbi:MAG: four helix bundle protein [Gammaproteobacteria bacterium]|nr:four helix bundle protein [Gammaproteobacteria bacterium]MBU1777337.1 four helix bundle protein [Gammaproteobacteria bacterium]